MHYSQTNDRCKTCNCSIFVFWGQIILRGELSRGRIILGDKLSGGKLSGDKLSEDEESSGAPTVKFKDSEDLEKIFHQFKRSTRPST
jgi:hypothetical protein